MLSRKRQSVGAGEVQRLCLSDSLLRVLRQQYTIPNIGVDDRLHSGHVGGMAAVTLAKLGWRKVYVAF